MTLFSNFLIVNKRSNEINKKGRFIKQLQVTQIKSFKINQVNFQHSSLLSTYQSSTFNSPMSFHTLNHKYQVPNPHSLPDSLMIINKPTLNINNSKDWVKQSQFSFQNYDMQKGLITQVQLAENNQKIKNINLINSEVGKTIQKPKTSSLADQRKQHMLKIGQTQQNLIKTVKHSNFSYNKLQPQSNPQSFRQNLTPQTQKVTIPSGNKSSQIENKNDGRCLILSIQKIREIEKKQLDEKLVHKITSSSSRQKLKTSSSKDSKGSVNIDKGPVNTIGKVQRYNKYINEGLIDIDIKKQIATNLVVPNLHLRKFGHLSNSTHQAVVNHQRLNSNHSQPLQTTKKENFILNTPKVKANDYQSFDNQILTCQQSIPREDQRVFSKIKSRSKSNLSKYTQLAQKQTIVENKEEHIDQYCKKVDIQSFETPQKIYESVKNTVPQKGESKIHRLSYSSNKNKVEVKNQKDQFLNSISLANQQDRNLETARTRGSQLGISLNQRVEGVQTQRKYHPTNQNFISNRKDLNGQFEHLLLEQKLKRKPIRLTIQKRN